MRLLKQYQTILRQIYTLGGEYENGYLVTQSVPDGHFSHMRLFHTGMAATFPHISIAATTFENFNSLERYEDGVLYRFGPSGISYADLSDAIQGLEESINHGRGSSIVGRLGVKGTISFKQTREGDFVAWGNKYPRNTTLPRFNELGLALLHEYLIGSMPVSFEELMLTIAARYAKNIRIIRSQREIES